MATNYPWEIKDVEAEVAEQVMALYTGHNDGYVRIGPKGYFFPYKFKHEAANIYNMEIRPTDVFVASYPRSGTTWTQELVWMIVNDLDYATSEVIALNERFPFLEYPMLISTKMEKKLKEQNKDNEHKENLLKWVTRRPLDWLDAMTTQRFIKTHLPLSLLSPKILDTAKLVYVARDPRDVVVSFYHFIKSLTVHGYVGDLKSFWNLLINDTQMWTPYFDHLKEAWAKRHNPNMLFLFYEQMCKDLPATVRRMVDFFNKKFSDEQVAELCEHLSFNSFKTNKSINYNFNAMIEVGIMGKNEFIRRGKSGGWRESFDDEMTAEAEKWIADNLIDTDLRFPHLE